jgi:uncharacterized protein YidB (DUF937 family)
MSGMSGMDDLLGGLMGGKGGSGGGNQALTALLPVVAGLLANGGLQKIMAGFQSKGMGEQAASWVGTGENEPVSAQQVREVVGDEEVGRVAQQLGVSEDQAADALAEALPQAIDRASPNGELAPQAELDDAFAQLAPRP